MIENSSKVESHLELFRQIELAIPGCVDRGRVFWEVRRRSRKGNLRRRELRLWERSRIVRRSSGWRRHLRRSAWPWRGCLKACPRISTLRTSRSRLGRSVRAQEGGAGGHHRGPVVPPQILYHLGGARSTSGASFTNSWNNPRRHIGRNSWTNWRAGAP